MTDSDKSNTEKSQEYRNFEILAGKVFQAKPKSKNPKGKGDQKPDQQSN